MEQLVDSGMIEALIDLTRTEIADMMVGGVFPSTEDRLGAVIPTGVPYGGSVGVLDMVNFGARETIPTKFSDGLFHVHNPQVTLMRTALEENNKFADWIAKQLNLMTGPVQFLLPEGGVSSLDAARQAFHDPDAFYALYHRLINDVVPTQHRQLILAPHNLNTAAFAEAALKAYREIT